MKDKVTFITALEELGLAQEFAAFASVPRPAGALRQWVMDRPALAARAFIPVCFKSVRKTLGCSIGHGGLRPPPRQHYLNVCHKQ